MGLVRGADNADVFHGDGVLPGKLRLEVGESIEPIQLPKRRVPVALCKPLKEELASLQQRCIITTDEKSTDWIAYSWYVYTLHKQCAFFVVDVKNGFWHV